MKEKAGEYIHRTTGEVYHTPDFTTTAKKIFKEAIYAFKQRRDEKIASAKREAAEKELQMHPEKYYVQIDDSLQSGNCYSLTKKYAEHIFSIIGAQRDCAVRADIILKDRDDIYTRRACIYAVSHRSAKAA